MDTKSLKRTLLIYLAYAWLISSVLSVIILLIEYNPSTKKAIERFGVGSLVLNSILWSLLFTITGSTSLFNVYRRVYNNFFLSLICFLLLPVIAATITISITKNTELFGVGEVAIAFLVTQLFFFFRFRSCVKRTKDILGN
jgi:hypothetical protein